MKPRYVQRVIPNRRKPSRRAIDLTKGPEPEQPEDTVIRSSNPPRLIESILIKGLSFQPEGVTFEVGLDLQLDDESFFRIEKITRHGHRYLFKGRRLFRPKAFNNNKLPNIIPHARHELVWVPQRTSQVLPNRVVGITKIVFTNERSSWGKARVKTCRIKVVYSYRESTHDHPVKAANWVVRDLTFEESDPGKGLTNRQLREKWRGSTTPFGEGKVGAIVQSVQRRREDSPEIIDLDNILPTPPSSPPTSSTLIDLTLESQNAYTFGDGFCGAGGASCGARQAGLKVKWSFDMNENAMKSYGLNFPRNETKSRRVEAHQFFQKPMPFLRVDIMHCSPPCQTFSPAHTVNNEVNDDRNSACLVGMRQAVERVRPRVLTMEETFGLEHEAHRPNLNRVIMDLIELGYSVRWEVIKLGGYGVPQLRKRLILIATG
jgi:DNA (cytosine-5)-methyltransferase 1